MKPTRLSSLAFRGSSTPSFEGDALLADVPRLVDELFQEAARLAALSPSAFPAVPGDDLPPGGFLELDDARRLVRGFPTRIRKSR